MRSLRWAGLLLIYVGAQVVALLLAFPFKSAGLATTSNPNSPTDPLLIIGVIIVAPLAILWGARRSGGLSALRWIVLMGMGLSLDLMLEAVLGLVTPAPFFLPPFGLGQVAVVAIPLAAIASVTLFLALLIEPQWFVVDAAGFLAGAALIGLLGISFGILPCFILLSALAVYDYIAVYRTRHMVSLADVVTDLKLPILMVVPASAGYDYTRSGSFQTQRAAPLEEREAMFMGLGDVVIPGTLIVSAFVWLPAVPTIVGIGANLLTAVGALLGSLLGYAFLMRRVASGNAQAGLPFLNGGALAGYILTFLAVYHSGTLGLTLAL